jgi:hypothetical protein
MPVTDLDLTNYIPAPVEGKTIESKFPSNNGQYIVKNVSWVGSSPFEPNIEYSAKVELQAKSGYTFIDYAYYLFHAEADSTKTDHGIVANLAGDTLTAIVTFRKLSSAPAIADENTLYVSSTNGNDTTNNGTTITTPLATIKKALAIAEGKTGTVEIVLLSDLVLETSEGDATWTGCSIGKSHPDIILRSYRDRDTYRQWSILMMKPDSGTNKHLFVVGEGGNLTLKDITLDYRGKKRTNGSTVISLVSVNGTDAKLTLESGAVIQNALEANSGPVSVGNFGTIIMNKGIIKDNEAASGAVYVNVNGKFIMNGGTIKDNTGHGVTNVGTFVMNGGSITGNTKDGVSNYNTVQWTHDGADFKMTGGAIRGNTRHGVSNNDYFTMSGGVIAGNSGCGVSNNKGEWKTTFTKEGGGVIYGSEAADGLKNNSNAVGSNDFNESAWTETLWEEDTYSFSFTP